MLVVLPHPDDEVFFCATLRQLSTAGDELHLIYVTPGGLAPQGSRRRLVARALNVVGLTGSAVEVLEFPDGHCIDHMSGLRNVLTDRVATTRPRAVCTVAYEGGHPDHDACHWATVQAARTSVPACDLLEFPTYRRGGRLFTAGVLLPGDGTVLRTPLGPEGLRLKTLVLRTHGLHGTFLRWFLYLFLDRGEMLLGEQYRLVPQRNYLNPPHPGRLGYELYTRFRFRDFRSRVEACSA